MKYQLVLQFPGETEDDFDKLIEIEDELDVKLKGLAEVDGHDFGSSEMNIFILTDNPKQIFSLILQTLKNNKLFTDVKSAYRETTGDKYTILWPENLNTFSIK